MPNNLDLPPELISLIEKREEDDRRKKELDDRPAPRVERRQNKDRRNDGDAPSNEKP